MKASARTISLLLVMCGAGLSAYAVAQGFPSRTVRVVVPVAAGGTQDIVTRSIAQKLTEQLGQQVIVDNRPSASGVVGVEYVVKAPPDGYTYLAASNSQISAPTVVRNISYDVTRDFVGVSLLARVPFVLVINPHIPVRSVKELISLAKRRPNELTYGSAGNGTGAHFATELFSHLAAIRMTHVPYKGNAPALVDVLGGQISMLFDTLNTSIQHIQTGKVRGLGVSSVKRSPVFPDMPTIGEAGLSGYELGVFNTLLAAAGTPREIVLRMHAEIARAVQQPDLRDHYLKQGVELSASVAADECSAFVKTETAKYARIAQEAGIQPN